jgi:hypothetical protein
MISKTNVIYFLVVFGVFSLFGIYRSLLFKQDYHIKELIFTRFHLSNESSSDIHPFLRNSSIPVVRNATLAVDTSAVVKSVVTVPVKPALVHHQPPPDFTINQDIIKCSNQSRCIEPVIQLKTSFKVYFCKHINYGIRFYFLIREGLLLHPKILLVDNIDQADYIVYLPESSRWEKSECGKPEYINKIILLDESDYPDLFEPNGIPKASSGQKEEDKSSPFLLAFKRSYVKRHDGVFKHYMNYVTHANVFPMAYIVAEAYIRHTFKHFDERPIELICSLRAIPSDPTRTRVKTWVDEYIQTRQLTGKAFSGEINHANRPVISKQYFERMYSSKIVVTSNPSNWEGDFRLCEALATGAVIFVDEMFVPRPKAFTSEKNIVFYNNHNKTDLFHKLDYYRSHHEKAKAVALAGYFHSLHYHRGMNLIDYVFRTLHVKLLAEKEGKMKELLHNIDFAKYYKTKEEGYEETGYYLRLVAVQKQKEILQRQQQQR